MKKLNCWDFKGCGRQPLGERASELGVCPAAEMAATNKVNGGKNGGRACWAIAGTFCGGKVQGTFASKVSNCMTCDFYRTVRDEEGAGFANASAILKLL